MSYLVLARRWRPQRFSDLVGQDVVVRTLKNALSGGHLAHAYLLCGIRGVGKTTIARLMAMAVNCEQADQGEPCGSCNACRGIATGSNLDVQEMDAASHTGVDDVREILDGVRYPPASLKKRVYIIDEAHMLSKSAFNALLKTLEEPPAHVMFILATTESDKLPVTVRSRCQRFDLRRLGHSEISGYLSHVFGRESVDADADAIAAIARSADGSVRDALSLSERVLAYAGKRMVLADVDAALGQVGTEPVRQLSRALFTGDAAEAVQLLRTVSATGHGGRTLLLELARLWHQLACLQVDETLLGEEVDAEQRQWLQQYAASLSSAALDLRYQVLLAGMRDLSLVDERMGAEMILMRLCGLNAISAVGAVPAISRAAGAAPVVAPVVRTEAVEPAVAAQEMPAAPVQLQPAEQEKPVAVQTQEADLPLHDTGEPAGHRCRDWREVVTALHDFRPGLAAMLEHVICLEFGSRVRLALERHQQATINAADRRDFAAWLGREVFWEARQSGEGESISQQRERFARVEKARLRKNAEDDPHVQALMAEMDAQLVSVLPAGVEDETGVEE
ncbi:DNA polymerase III subunit gamma/tau [Mariprofundus erugo]|uniref:DNA polymerase III subunit gamma/tau n=1 Tax=Mariprofundus erugo TaxID=2528639 RepID=UPI0010FF4240|nr:DNA polymerase III subunit gamma/tau [Mariprofundus erugo]TLS76507.1 DNA polymerase III subunit gamma/tau [Mariprofundus erugo]